MKRIFSILIIVTIIVIMSLPSMAWDGYPNTPSSELYDNSYIYQVILLKDHVVDGTKTWMVVSQTPFYRADNQYGKRIRSSSDIYMIEYVNGNWEYWGYLGSTQGTGFDDAILQATYDIYTDSTLTDVFFSAPQPTPTPLVMVQTLTQHPPLTLMKSRLVGLIPLLIGLLIVLVGFYKGLSVLFKALRQA